MTELELLTAVFVKKWTSRLPVIIHSNEKLLTSPHARLRGGS